MQDRLFSNPLYKLIENNLTKLSIDANELTFATMKILAKILKTNTSLETLTIADGHLSDESIQCLAEALKYNNTLRNLNLVSTRMSDTAAQALAVMLHHNNGLISVSLENNNITAVGGRCFVDAVLKHNRTLGSLNLHDNCGLTEIMKLIDKVLDERKIQYDASMKQIELLTSGMRCK